MTSRPDLQPIYDLVSQGRLSTARNLCNEEIEKNPESGDAYALRAGISELMGNRDDALTDRSRVVSMFPNRAEVYFLRAKTRMHFAEYQAAIPDLTKAAALDDGWLGPATYLHRAECHYRLGNGDDAIRDCALVPDDYIFPGFRALPHGSKHHILADIRAHAAASRGAGGKG